MFLAIPMKCVVPALISIISEENITRLRTASCYEAIH